MIDVLLINPAGYVGNPRRGPYELAELVTALAWQGLSSELVDVQYEVGRGAVRYPSGHLKDVSNRLVQYSPRLAIVTF